MQDVQTGLTKKRKRKEKKKEKEERKTKFYCRKARGENITRFAVGESNQLKELVSDNNIPERCQGPA